MMRGILTLPADARVIEAALEGLTLANEVYLRRRPNTPLIGCSGVRYAWEPPGRHWWTVPEVRIAGKGDCKDFSSWRAAELRVYFGVPREEAYVIVHRTGPRMFHARTMTPWGIEDPSVALGMRSPSRRR